MPTDEVDALRRAFRWEGVHACRVDHKGPVPDRLAAVEAGDRTALLVARADSHVAEAEVLFAEVRVAVSGVVHNGGEGLSTHVGRNRLQVNRAVRVGG